MTRRDPGQAALEFAIALPLVAIVVLGLVQVAVVVSDQVVVELAAREGARAASVAASPTAAAAQAVSRTTDHPVAVATSVTDGWVSVRVTVVNSTDVPLIGAAIGPVELTAEVTMRREPP